MEAIRSARAHGVVPDMVRELAGVVVVFLAGAVLLWISAPHNGEFWWSDSPRHALNGVFLKDAVLAFPWRDPVGYATQYYLQYPALTILFYPPLFYVLSAPFYALFGASHATGLAVVLLHYVALALGLYLLCRRWLQPLTALALALAIMAVPGVALWGRQIMLEIPAMAFAVWALLILRRYIDSSRPGALYLGAFLLLCAIYTKFSAIFLAPVVALMILTALGNKIWRNRHIWTAAILFAVGLVPVVLLTLKFGQANVQSVVGIADSEISRSSLAGWVWYAKQWPEQLGWPLLAASIVGLAALWRGYRDRDLVVADLILLLGWLTVGYLFFSMIDLKEARHSTLIVPPLLILAGLALERFLPPRVAGALALMMVIGTGIYTWRFSPVPAVAGYAEAADWIAREAPKNTIVMFSGYRDGSFVFNLRTHEDRRDLYTIRADKLLLEIAVRRELGVGQKALSKNEIGEMIDRYRVQYVVAQTDFWVDLEVMARLQEVLRSDQFEPVARIAVKANIPLKDKELLIYRNTHPIEPGGSNLQLDLPIVGRSLGGQIGAKP